MSKRLITFYSILFVFCAVIIFLLLYGSAKNKNNAISQVGPNPTPTEVISHLTVPTPTLPQQVSMQSLLTNLDNKKPLGASDTSLRQELISKANTQGIIEDAPLFKLHYVSDADVFNIEVVTSSVTPAIDAGVTWLREQGLTDAGICNLPVIIYRDPKKFDKTLTTGMEYYPLPISC